LAGVHSPEEDDGFDDRESGPQANVACVSFGLLNCVDDSVLWRVDGPGLRTPFGFDHEGAAGTYQQVVDVPFTKPEVVD
jgi:hypothetical protein